MLEDRGCGVYVSMLEDRGCGVYVWEPSYRMCSDWEPLHRPLHAAQIRREV